MRACVCACVCDVVRRKGRGTEDACAVFGLPPFGCTSPRAFRVCLVIPSGRSRPPARPICAASSDLRRTFVAFAARASVLNLPASRAHQALPGPSHGSSVARRTAPAAHPPRDTGAARVPAEVLQAARELFRAHLRSQGTLHILYQEAVAAAGPGEAVNHGYEKLLRAAWNDLKASGQQQYIDQATADHAAAAAATTAASAKVLGEACGSLAVASLRLLASVPSTLSLACASSSRCASQPLAGACWGFQPGKKSPGPGCEHPSADEEGVGDDDRLPAAGSLIGPAATPAEFARFSVESRDGRTLRARSSSSPTSPLGVKAR